MKIKKSQLILQKRRKKLKVLLIVLSSLTFICLIYWFIFLSNFFQIKQINVLNYKEELKEELIEEINQYFKKRNTKFVPFIIYKVFPGSKENYRNMLLFSKESLEQFLLNRHPEFKEIKSSLNISKQVLNITINLREVEYFFCKREESCYLVDKEGVIFAQAPSITGFLIKKIVSRNSSEIKLGQKLFTKEFWQKIEKYYFLTNQDNSPFKIDSIIAELDNYSSIKIKTDKGWFLYLNLNENPEYILKIVSQLNQEKNLAKIEYIDCRFLPKIYLK